MSDVTLTTELRLLTYTAFICLLLWVPYVLGVIRTRGLVRAVGYPSGIADDLPPWAQRAERAHMNLVENLAPFAALVLVAHRAAARHVRRHPLGAHPGLRRRADRQPDDLRRDPRRLSQVSDAMLRPSTGSG